MIQFKVLNFGVLGSGKQEHGMSSELLRIGRSKRDSPASMRQKQDNIIFQTWKTGVGHGEWPA